MGGCTVKSTHTPEQAQKKVSIPECSYFCRSKKDLFLISPDKVTKIKLKGKLKAYPDSGTGLTSSGAIILIGGTDSSGSLTTRVFVIRPSDRAADELAPVPKPTKEGHVFEHNGFYYYVGGTVEAESVDAIHSFEGAPILRYSIDNKQWESFSHDKDPKAGLEKALNRNITDKEEHEEILVDEQKFSLKDIVSPGVFLFEDRAYLVGGKCLEGTDYKPTNKVFSIGLKDGKFDFRQESFNLPVKLVNPVCAAGNVHSVVTGGLLENGGHNVDIYVFDFNKMEVLKNDGKLDSELKENYPPSYNKDEIIFFSFPKIFIKPKKDANTISFSFKKKDKTTKGDGYRSAEITIKPLQASKPAIKKKIDLSLNVPVVTEHHHKKKHKVEAGGSLSLKMKSKSSSSSSSSKKKHKKKHKGKIDIPVVKGEIKIGKKSSSSSSSSSSSKKKSKVQIKASSPKADLNINLKKKKSGSSSSNKKKASVTITTPGAPYVSIGKKKSSSSSSSSSKKKGKGKISVSKGKVDIKAPKVEIKGAKKSSSSSSSSSSKKKAKIGLPSVKVDAPKVKVKSV
jgi:hypothetical protein